RPLTRPRHAWTQEARHMPGLFLFSHSSEAGTTRRERCIVAFGPTPRPVDRRSLFARSGHPVLTRAQDIHVLLSATPGRQGANRCDWGCNASVGATSVVNAFARRRAPALPARRPYTSPGQTRR